MPDRSRLRIVFKFNDYLIKYTHLDCAKVSERRRPMSLKPGTFSLSLNLMIQRSSLVQNINNKINSDLVLDPHREP